MTPTVETGKRDTRRTITWAGAQAADNATMGRYQPLFSLTTASVQVSGTGSAALHGSNDGVNYVPLNDLAGAAISLSGGAIAEFSTGVAFIKPVVTGGPVTITVAHWAG